MVLTETGQLPTEPGQRGYGARTDVKMAVIAQRDWIFVPQPGRVDKPTVSMSISLLAVVIFTVFNSMVLK